MTRADAVDVDGVAEDVRRLRRLTREHAERAHELSKRLASVRARRDARRVVPSTETDESPAFSLKITRRPRATFATFARRDEDDDHRTRLTRESDAARGTIERGRVDIAGDV